MAREYLTYNLLDEDIKNNEDHGNKFDPIPPSVWKEKTHEYKLKAFRRLFTKKFTKPQKIWIQYSQIKEGSQKERTLKVAQVLYPGHDYSDRFLQRLLDFYVTLKTHMFKKRYTIFKHPNYKNVEKIEEELEKIKDKDEDHKIFRLGLKNGKGNKSRNYLTFYYWVAECVTAHPYNCDSCDKSFHNSTLKDPMKNVHNKKPNLNLDESRVKIEPMDTENNSTVVLEKYQIESNVNDIDQSVNKIGLSEMNVKQQRLNSEENKSIEKTSNQNIFQTKIVIKEEIPDSIAPLEELSSEIEVKDELPNNDNNFHCE